MLIAKVGYYQFVNPQKKGTKFRITLWVIGMINTIK